MARPPNTDYPWKMMLYKQRKTADYIAGLDVMKTAATKEVFDVKFMIHGDKRRYQREIQKRVTLKDQEYDNHIKERRGKLTNMFADEERAFLKETVDVAQRGNEFKLIEMKQKSKELAAIREAERLKLLEEKRVQQYADRSVDLREQLALKNLVESKLVQLEQIKENEMKREMERERDALYDQVVMKELMAKAEREEQTNIKAHHMNHMSILEKQIKAKELLKCEQERIAAEDRIEMDRFREKVQKQETEVIQARKIKEAEATIQLMQQIADRKIAREKQRIEEKAIQDAYNELLQRQLDEEKSKSQDTTSVNKREMALYRQSLDQLRIEREIEEKKMDKAAKIYQADIQNSRDQAACKIVLARRKLHEEVLRERNRQIEFKQKAQQSELKKQHEQDKITRERHEADMCLEKERARRQAEERKIYSNELTQQISYRKLVQLREEEEVERQLEIGRKEEMIYQQKLNDLLSGKADTDRKHPFMQVLNPSSCECPVKLKPC